MALNLVITNYSNGYVAEYVQNGTEICSSWILLPAENLWPKELRAFLYVLAMLYLFIGVAIGSDVFMTSIEVSVNYRLVIMRCTNINIAQ